MLTIVFKTNKLNDKNVNPARVKSSRDGLSLSLDKNKARNIDTAENKLI